MPLISDESKNKTTDYKQTYRNLKRKLKILIYENEYYQEELKKYQKQLLNVNRDKCFLMEKLLQYEDINSSSSDSDATDFSESEIEIKQERPAPSTNRRRRLDSTHSETTGQPTCTASKRRRINSNGGITPATSTQLTQPSSTSSVYQASSRGKNLSTGKKNNKATPSTSMPVSTLTSTLITPSTSVTLTSTQTSTSVATSQLNISTLSQAIKTEFPITKVETEPLSLLSLGRVNGGQFTPEEIERHFESRPIQPSLLLPEKTPLTVPVELFSNESSHDLPELDIKTELPNG